MSLLELPAHAVKGELGGEGFYGESGSLVFKGNGGESHEAGKKNQHS